MYSKILKITVYTSVVANIVAVAGLYVLQKQFVYANEFSTDSLSNFIGSFYPWFITISSGLAVIMLIYSGYLMMTSAGNIEQVNKGKEYIIGALTGLAFIILAGLIYNTIKI